MQKVSIEDMIISLLIIGFNEVDAILVSFTFSYLSKMEYYKNNFIYVDLNTTSMFSKCVEYTNKCYKFKNNVSLENKKELFKKNEMLINYLKTIDFKEINENINEFMPLKEKIKIKKNRL